MLSKLDKRLILPGLVVGSVIPDIEVPFMWVFFSEYQDHFILHSLIGALTLGLLAAVLVTRFLYPPIISFVFGVDKDRLNEACRLKPILVLSCAIGVLSHLVLDVPMHPYNPILWPWVPSSNIVGILVLFFAQGNGIAVGFVRANALMSVVMLFFCVSILVRYRKKKLWEHVWLGDDVGESQRVD